MLGLLKLAMRKVQQPAVDPLKRKVYNDTNHRLSVACEEADARFGSYGIHVSVHVPVLSLIALA